MNRVLILVNLTGLIIGISYGLHGPILPIFAKNVIGATYSELGLIGLANFVPYMFIPLFVGILLYRINNTYLLAIGAAINSASIYLLSIAQSVPELLGFRIMTGVAHAFFWPPCESIISNESTEKNRVKNISWFTMFFVMGFIFGTVVFTNNFPIFLAAPGSLPVPKTSTTATNMIIIHSLPPIFSEYSNMFRYFLI